MILASIILPLTDNKGQPIASIHDGLEETLIDLFGGVTSSVRQGAWKHEGKVYREAVRQYDVFVDETDQGKFYKGVTERAFRYIAQDVGQAAGQIAVSIIVDGKPEIVTVTYSTPQGE